MLTKFVLAAVSLYLAAEGFSLLTAPPSLVREAILKANRLETGQGTRPPA